MILYIFPVFLLLVHLKYLIVSLGATFDGAVLSTKQSRAHFFCEVVHSEAICRKRDSTASICGAFLEDISLPFTIKGTQEPVLFTGENVSPPSCLHGKLTNHGYL